MNRNKEYRIGVSNKHINRKLNIILHVWSNQWMFNKYSNEPNRLSKKKIHCSCPLCSEKTNRHHESLHSHDSRRMSNHWKVRDVRNMKVNDRY